MARPSHPVALMLCVLALILPACATRSGPTVEVVDAALTELTDAGMVIRFALDARNTSPDPLTLREIVYSLTLDGVVVFKGTRSAEATIRRFGTQTIDLPVAIPMPEGPPRGQVPYELIGSISYIPPGAFAEVLYDANLVRPTITFHDRRRIDFDELLGDD